MAYKSTNPELVISRMRADAARLLAWANAHGSPTQQRIALQLRDVIVHVEPEFFTGNDLNVYGKREFKPRDG